MSTTMTAPTALPVRIPGNPPRDRFDRLLLVNDPTLGEVAVRWAVAPNVPLWRCKACGPQWAADCVHSFSAGLHLAADLLGLAPAIDTVKETP